ncbi:zinc finger protein 182 [Drosophila innubila]|uniref:zinc finger protein 182 n=1 Tax=Drosophila innubila TaxID=198719 RepID=UPI00148DC3F4|nr:zinc finger protein 182 [Drosophila innubila]
MDNAEPICRICLLQPKIDTLMPTDSDFCANIEQCTGVLLTQDADLPNKICTSCALLLRAALKLRTLCQQAEQQLQKLKQEQQEQQMKVDSDCDMSTEFVESYEVTLETASTTGSHCSADVVTIKPSSPAHATVPASKPNRRSRSTAVAVPSSHSPTHSSEANPSTGLSYACNICNNVYTEKVKLTAHLKVHSEHKPHECEICHKRFRQTPQLARHMNSHTGLRPYKCDYCDSSFADPSTRIKHQRIHTNERPYKCKFCSKSFAYSNVLNVHLKTHTGERPFSCQYCERRFSQMHHKNTHERAHRAKDLDITVISLEEE